MVNKNEIVWRYGGIRRGGWALCAEFQREPHPADWDGLPALSFDEVIEFMAEQRLELADVRRALGQGDSWDANVFAIDRMRQDLPALRIEASVRDAGHAVIAKLDVAESGDRKVLIIVPGHRIAGATTRRLGREISFLERPAYRHLLYYVRFERLRQKRRSLAFTVPISGDEGYGSALEGFQQRLIRAAILWAEDRDAAALQRPRRRAAVA